MLLAIVFLKEIFIWRYDIPALFFIILGSGFIILTANFQEVEIDVAELKSLLSSPKSIIYFTFVFFLIIATFCVKKRMLAALS